MSTVDLGTEEEEVGDRRDRVGTSPEGHTIITHVL